MAGSFGALAAMNETIKKNRDMLKRNKKKPFTKDEHYYAKRTETLMIRERKLSEGERMVIIRQTWQIREEERRKQFIVLAFSVAIAVALVAGFLVWWKAWQGS